MLGEHVAEGRGDQHVAKAASELIGRKFSPPGKPRTPFLTATKSNSRRAHEAGLVADGPSRR